MAFSTGCKRPLGRLSCLLEIFGGTFLAQAELTARLRGDASGSVSAGYPGAWYYDREPSGSAGGELAKDSPKQ
eukprot:4148539-Amphidinium_carterae.1